MQTKENYTTIYSDGNVQEFWGIAIDRQTSARTGVEIRFKELPREGTQIKHPTGIYTVGEMIDGNKFKLYPQILQ